MDCENESKESTFTSRSADVFGNGRIHAGTITSPVDAPHSRKTKCAVADICDTISVIICTIRLTSEIFITAARLIELLTFPTQPGITTNVYFSFVHLY